MRQKVKYKQPRRFNPVSFMFILLGIAAVYCLVQFGPPYWRQFRVKEVLKDAAVRYRTMPELDEPAQKTAARFKEVGIEDENVQVSMKREGEEMIVEAAYREIVQHPFINKITILEFNPKVAVRIKY